MVEYPQDDDSLDNLSDEGHNQGVVADSQKAQDLQKAANDISAPGGKNDDMEIKKGKGDKNTGTKSSGSFAFSDELIKEEFKDMNMKTFSDPMHLVEGVDKDGELSQDEYCPKLAFTDKVGVSRQRMLDVPFERIRAAIKKIPEFENLVQKAYKKFNSKFPEESQWLRFGGSSVWLDEFQVHYMVSRVLFLHNGVPNKGYVSFFYIQLFDQNWKELPPTKLEVP